MLEKWDCPSLVSALDYATMLMPSDRYRGGDLIIVLPHDSCRGSNFNGSVSVKPKRKEKKKKLRIRNMT